MGAERALAKVLQSDHFAAHGSEALATTDGFVRAVRSAPHAEVLRLQRWLEDLAFETEDYGEASGVLLQVAAFGGGLTDVASDDTLPLADSDALASRIISTDHADRPDLYTAILDGIARDNATQTLTAIERHRALSLAHYGAAPAPQILQPDAVATWTSDVAWADQTPPRLWEVFSSRPADEISSLADRWWGAGDRQTNDVAVALQLEAAGHIDISRAPTWPEAVLEHLLWSWGDNAADALRVHPALASDAHEGLATVSGVLWLATEDARAQAAHLESLFAAGLDRGVVEHALARTLEGHEGGDARPYLAALAEELSD